MSTELLGHRILDSADSSTYLPQAVFEGANRIAWPQDARPFPDELDITPQQKIDTVSEFDEYSVPKGVAFHPAWKNMSSWSRSAGKRIFDCACVIAAAPILIPLILIIGAAVRLTSQGPVLFLQTRMGRYGRSFTILKFRTMIHVRHTSHHPITTADNQRFTPIGPFLRRWKLDELPQLANVLLGHMSLVGPRPKLQEHVTLDLPCRPGITGMATTVFASEETILARIPKDRLDTYYHAIVLPAKRQLDSEYMARATFLSDLHLLVNSVLRRWDHTALESFIVAAAAATECETIESKMTEPSRALPRRPVQVTASHAAGVEQVSAF